MGLGTKLFRSILLSLAGNRIAKRLATKYGMRLGAGRFVAGVSVEEALLRTQAMNSQGIAVTLDHLGEGIAHLAEAVAFKEEYLRLLEEIARTNLKASVSLKPTQMGLLLDPEQCYANIREIVLTAKQYGNEVTLDMEDNSCTDGTIKLVRRLHVEGLSNAGTVLQAYLYRSMEDLETLTHDGIPLRLVKGAYKEPRRIAYPRLSDVNDIMLRLIEKRLESGVYTAIATHDERMIDWTRHYVRTRSIPLERFEFQMLYGIRTKLQQQLAAEGFTVRCYVPYGRMWYPYFIRRLAERPANLLFILKNRSNS
jgi:proline dehydrogenase